MTRSVFLCSVAVGVLSSSAQAQDDMGIGIADIVVTAQKREQRLQDVPVSISALNADALQANRIANLSDLNSVSPNLSIRETSGGGGLPSLTMRGALSVGVAPGADREVGFYVDGVYIGHATGSMFELADVERIEVLRGPQGTLFGRNATAGAISFITKNPKGEFALHQEFTVGNYDQFRSKTRIDLPAFGPFSAAIAYTHTERRGETRNLGAGTVWDYSAAGRGRRVSPKWLGDDNKEVVAAALRYDGGDFTTTYKFDWATVHGSPVAIGFPGYGPGLSSFDIPAFYAAQDPSKMTPISLRRPDAVNNSFTTSVAQKVQAHNLTSEWTVSDSLSLKNVFGYRKVHSFVSQELGALGGMMVPNTDTPFVLYGNVTEFRHKQISDELQLNYKSDAATVTAGLLYYSQKQGSGGPLGLTNGNSFKAVPDYVLTCADAFSCLGPVPTKGTSKAAFIQAEGHITSDFDIIGGFRVTQDKKSGGFSPRTFDVKDTNTNYMVGVNYRPTSDVMLFAKYSTAFMSGGGNIGAFFPELQTYAPETAKSWEAGIKSDWLDRRLRANLSLFDVTYKDIQWITSGIFCGDAKSGTCVFTLGDGRARGAELELTMAPTRGLIVTSGVGYTDFKYKKLTDLALGSSGFFGVTYRPEWTVNNAVQYDTPSIDALGGGHVSVRVDANFQSEMLGAADAAPAYIPLVKVPGIVNVNGRIALSNIDLAGHRAEISLWGKNLTDNDQISMTSSFGFMFPATYQRARTYGVDLKFDW